MLPISLTRGEASVQLAPAISIIRIFSEDKAKEFYLDFLGFTLQWKHRFEPGFPLYAQISRSDLTLPQRTSWRWPA